MSAESRLLGACMSGGPAVTADIAGMGVTDAVFSETMNGAVWLGLVAAAVTDKRTSPFIVARRAFGTPLSDEQVRFIEDLAKLEPTSIFARKLAIEVLGEYRRKRVAGHLARAVEIVAGTEPWDETWDVASAILSDATRSAVDGVKTVDLNALCDAVLVEESSDKPKGTVGTGIENVDAEFGLIARGEVCVIAGRPGVGKTALALQMGDSQVKKGGCVMIVSLEMNAVSMLSRLSRQRAGRRGTINKGCTGYEFNAAKSARIDAIEEIRKTDGRLHIFEVSDCATLARIEARVHLLAARSIPLDCVVIDYLQLITPDDPRMSREQQVALISRRVKLMAIELNIPVLLLSQLNRDAEKNDRVPRLSDLRESGAIEQDADRVWLIYPSPDAPSDGNNTTATIRLEQAKNRNGRRGQATDLNFYQPAFIFSK